MKKDNSTFAKKAALRRHMLTEVAAPAVVMETHGGYGKIWGACYSHIQNGIVFETDDAKADFLARQRPSWAVYQANCIDALRAGAGAHLTVNVLDLDPYGESWPVLDAFLESPRPRAPILHLVVNDGLLQSLRMGGAWHVGSLRGIVERFGNDLSKRYLEVCRELVKTKAEKANYSLLRFAGYYTGASSQMTHYYAVLRYESSAN